MKNLKNVRMELQMFAIETVLWSRFMIRQIWKYAGLIGFEIISNKWYEIRFVCTEKRE